MLMRGSIIRWVVLFSGVFVIELVMRSFFLILGGDITSASSIVTCRTAYWVVMRDLPLPYYFCEYRDD